MVVLIEFSINFVFRMRSMFITRVMPMQVIQVIKIACIVSINAFRRRGLFLRRFANSNVSRDQV